MSGPQPAPLLIPRKPKPPVFVLVTQVKSKWVVAPRDGEALGTYPSEAQAKAFKAGWDAHGWGRVADWVAKYGAMVSDGREGVDYAYCPE